MGAYTLLDKIRDDPDLSQVNICVKSRTEWLSRAQDSHAMSLTVVMQLPIAHLSPIIISIALRMVNLSYVLYSLAVKHSNGDQFNCRL